MMNCSSQKDYITDSDYSFQGRFKKYKTFEFMTMGDSNDTFFNEILEKSGDEIIRKRVTALLHKSKGQVQ